MNGIPWAFDIWGRRVFTGMSWEASAFRHVVVDFMYQMTIMCKYLRSTEVDILLHIMIALNLQSMRF